MYTVHSSFMFGALFLLIVSYLMSRVLVPLLVFRETRVTRSFVSAASLYSIIKANTYEEHEEDMKGEEYYIHVAYDIPAQTVVLLRVTSSGIVRLISYDLPSSSTIHVRFAKSWCELKRTYIECQRQGRLPHLTEVVSLVDRRTLVQLFREDIPVGVFNKPLSVRVSDGGSTVTYTDSSDISVSFRLPEQLRAILVRHNNGNARVDITTKSPCETPDRVTYNDYKRYYRDVLTGRAAITPRTPEMELPAFAWNCAASTDMHPVLILKK